MTKAAIMYPSYNPFDIDKYIKSSLLYKVFVLVLVQFKLALLSLHSSLVLFVLHYASRETLNDTMLEALSTHCIKLLKATAWDVDNLRDKQNYLFITTIRNQLIKIDLKLYDIFNTTQEILLPEEKFWQGVAENQLQEVWGDDEAWREWDKHFSKSKS